MLRYFRINDPYRMLGLLIILIIIYLPLFISSPGLTYIELKSMVVGEKIHGGSVPYSSIIDSTAPLASWFFGLIDILFGRSLLARHILGFLILFSQSLFFGLMLIDKKAFAESTYIPSFLFSLLAFFSFDTISISGELLGSGFLLLALNNLFKELEFRTQRDDTVFNLGLYISLASLCNFSFIVHLFGIFAILLIYARTSPRGFLLLICGFLLPQLLMMSLYFLNDTLGDLWQFYYLPNLSFSSHSFINTKGLFMLGAIPAIYLLISIIILNREARFTKYQSQLLQSMFFWLIFSFLQILYSKNIRPQSFIVLIPGLSFFITHFLLLIRRRRFAEMNIWIIFIGTLTISFMARYNKLDAVDYTELLVKQQNAAVSGKRVLMLGDDFSIFKSNELATPFLNWKLCREIFEQPDYYENIILVNKAFEKDPPALVFDKNNLFAKFLDRIPRLKDSYKKTAEGVYQKVK